MVEHACDLGELGVAPRVPEFLLRPLGHFLSTQHRGVEQTVGDGLLDQRAEARRGGGGEQASRARDDVQILADDAAVVEFTAVVGD